MKVSLESLKNKAGWDKMGVRLPAYDVETMRAKTAEAPLWVHFGAGNIFRAFIAVLQQRLLDAGLSDKGIIAADTFDVDVFGWLGFFDADAAVGAAEEVVAALVR